MSTQQDRKRLLVGQDSREYPDGDFAFGSLAELAIQRRMGLYPSGGLGLPY